MEFKELGLEMAHIGINQKNPDEALSTVKMLGELFGFTCRETPGSWFVNEQFEVMKEPFLGKNGHIAIAAQNTQQAYEYFKSRGVAFAEETAVYFPNGRLNVIYFKDEIAGFAFHLVQKKDN